MAARRRTVTVISAAASGIAVLGGAVTYTAAHLLGVPITALLADRAAALSGKSIPMPGLALPPLSPRYWATIARDNARAVAAHIRSMAIVHKNQVGQSGVHNNNGGEIAARTFRDPEKQMLSLAEEMSAATRRFELTNAKILGEEVLAAFPNAATIRVRGTLSGYFTFSDYFEAALFDTDDKVLGYFYADTIETQGGELTRFDFNISKNVWALPLTQRRIVTRDESGATSTVDPDYTWLGFDENGAVIDVRKAAAIQV